VSHQEFMVSCVLEPQKTECWTAFFRLEDGVFLQVRTQKRKDLDDKMIRAITTYQPGMCDGRKIKLRWWADE
jgi:hypothetical protein